MKIVAIVLAAGLSSRFGVENKLLHEIDGRPIITTVLEALIDSKVAEIIVVTGHEKNAVCAALPVSPKIRVIQNLFYALGMSTSISKGIASLGMDTNASMICLADMPYLTCEDYDLMINSFGEVSDSQAIMMPIYNLKNGHPVVFDKHYFASLRNLPVSDTGAYKVVNANSEHVHYVQLDHDRILKDIDFKPSEKQ